MATYYSLNHTKLRATPRQMVDDGDFGGHRFGVFDTYTATGAEVAGSVIYLGRIPPNHRVVDGWIKYDAMGASVTVKIGDAGDDDRFVTATAVSSAGVTRMTAATGLGWLNASDSPMDVFATTAGGALTAAAVLTVCLTTQTM
jgi:hypothetical protein